MKPALFGITLFLLLAACSALAGEPADLRSEVALEKEKRITTLFRGTKRVMKRAEYDSKANGVYDRLIEGFYYDGEMVFTYSHFEPASPSGMYHSSKGVLIFCGSLGADDPKEVLLIGLPTEKQFCGYVLENGIHRPMTNEEIAHIREVTAGWSQTYDAVPKPSK